MTRSRLRLPLATTSKQLVIASNYTSTLVAMVTAPLLARGLGPGGRGQLAGIVVSTEMLCAVAGLGLPPAAAYAWRAQGASAVALLRSLRRPACLVLPGSALVGWWVAGSVLETSPLWQLAVLALIGVMPPLALLGDSARQLLVAAGRLSRLSTLLVLPPGVILLGIAVAFVTDKLSVGLAAVVTMLALAATHVMAILHAARLPGGSAPRRARSLTSFALRAYPGSLTALANNRVDQLLILPLLGARELGFYAVAVAVNFVLVKLGHSLGFVAFASIGPDSPEAASAVQAAVRSSMRSAVAVAVAVAVAAPVAIPLVFGEAFTPSVLPTLLLLPGSVAFSAHLVARQCALAVGRPGISAVAEGAGLAVTGVALLALLPIWGVAGAAVASTTAYCVRLVVMLVLLTRSMTGEPASDLDEQADQALTVSAAKDGAS